METLPSVRDKGEEFLRDASVHVTSILSDSPIVPTTVPIGEIEVCTDHEGKKKGREREERDGRSNTNTSCFTSTSRSISLRTNSSPRTHIFFSPTGSPIIPGTSNIPSKGWNLPIGNHLHRFCFDSCPVGSIGSDSRTRRAEETSDARRG